jgi:hypothetical protein
MLPHMPKLPPLPLTIARYCTLGRIEKMRDNARSPAMLPRAGFLPRDRRQFRICGTLQIRSRALRRSFLALFDIFYRLGGRKPTLRGHVIHGRLYALRVVL